MFNTDSAYKINEIVFGETISVDDADYVVFVLRGEAKHDKEKVLMLSLMSTDGKTFWPIVTNVEAEASFNENPFLLTKDRNLSAILQKTPYGRLVVSLFLTGVYDTAVESSHVITLPVETSLKYV